MKRHHFIIALLLFPITIGAQSKFEQEPLWEETFNDTIVSKPNPTTWSYITGMRGSELEYYTNDIENVFVCDGELNIKAIRIHDHGNAVCTSGRIHTRGKVTFMYGRLDIRAKLPVGKGIWPAFWMMPENSAYPYGEIDIIEYIDCWNAKKYQANVHVVRKEGGKEIREMNEKSVSVNVTDYHTYSLEWTQEELRFLIDGRLFHVCSKNNHKLWPFDQPYYLILNVAYGGWGGSCGLDESIFPCSLKVDWIRYYKLKPE